MSARGGIAELDVRRRIGHMLPALFHDDDFAQRWCAGLDDVVAPVPATLDSFWAYLDPQLAPVDFVEWLAAWVGLELDQTWTVARRRSLVSSAHSLHDFRGTTRGLADLIELYVGRRPEITEPGGASWAATPGSALPGTDGGELVVRLVVDDPDSIDRSRLEQMVEANKPAHVPHRIEVERGDGASPSESPAPPPQPPPPPPPVDESIEELPAPELGDPQPVDDLDSAGDDQEESDGSDT